MATQAADVDDYPFPLPGFRFHPTDEELVGFYLRRKVDKKAVAVELIKQIDIYKYNPWDLPHASSSTGEKEWYFFCKRGRKYKNSARPNRVTGSGFWKATGIDKPIYKHGGQTHHCIGLKKTLVFYKGSAGRGTKTEWMMNEFRLPSNNSNPNSDSLSKIRNSLEEAEIWTLCRIFKRSVSSRKNPASWREIPPATGRTAVGNVMFKQSYYRDTVQCEDEGSSFISFSSSFVGFEEKPGNSDANQWNQEMTRSFSGSTEPSADPSSTGNATVSPASSSFSDFDEEATDLFGYEKWEELKSIMEFD